MPHSAAPARLNLKPVRRILPPFAGCVRGTRFARGRFEDSGNRMAGYDSRHWRRTRRERLVLKAASRRPPRAKWLSGAALVALLVIGFLTRESWQRIDPAAARSAAQRKTAVGQRAARADLVTTQVVVEPEPNQRVP